MIPGRPLTWHPGRGASHAWGRAGQACDPDGDAERPSPEDETEALRQAVREYMATTRTYEIDVIETLGLMMAVHAQEKADLLDGYRDSLDALAAAYEDEGRMHVRLLDRTWERLVLFGSRFAQGDPVGAARELAAWLDAINASGAPTKPSPTMLDCEAP